MYDVYQWVEYNSVAGDSLRTFRLNRYLNTDASTPNCYAQRFSTYNLDASDKFVEF